MIISTNSCKKNSESPNQSQDTNDSLTTSQLQLIESMGIDTISRITDALFPDSTKISDWALKNDSGYEFKFNKNKSLLSVFDQKRLFIERMTQSGFILVDDYRYSFPSQLYGLAYVFGSKKFDNPSKYPGATCQQLLYGLDCSGMIKQMGWASSFDLILDGTVNYVNISTWNNAFKNSTDYQGLEMNDLGTLPATQLQAGDMIVASEVHIGMVFSNGIDLKIFNSLGSPSYTCIKNSDDKHGPVITNNVQVWLNQVFGNGYHVLRTKSIGTDINNTIWDVTIFFNATTSWHADVTFNANGTTKYDEPEFPGVYLTYGVWSTNNNSIHWSMGMDPDYIYNGTITGNTMSGTFIYNGETKTWSAVKR